MNQMILICDVCLHLLISPEAELCADCVWDLEVQSVAIIPLGQDKFSFSSNATGQVLCTLIKTSSFERTEEEIYCALEKTTFVTAFQCWKLQFRSRRPLCSCSDVTLLIAVPHCLAAGTSCTVQAPFSLRPFQHRAVWRTEDVGEWGKWGSKSFCWAFRVTALSLLIISLLEKPTTLSCVWPEFLPVSCD